MTCHVRYVRLENLQKRQQPEHALASCRDLYAPRLLHAVVAANWHFTASPTPSS